jgi:hypothetical protein
VEEKAYRLVEVKRETPIPVVRRISSVGVVRPPFRGSGEEEFANSYMVC